MAETVVNSNAHLEELAPSTAKMSKQTGYDTLDPYETRAYIADALRIYSKQYWPYKIRSRRNPISAFKTTWKIKHDGKHIGDIYLETHKPHGVGLDYGISKAIVKHGKLKFYAAHVKMVAQHVKTRIDWHFKVGEGWDIHGIPSSIKARKQWYAVYEAVQNYRSERQRECQKPTLADIVDFLNPEYSFGMGDDLPVFKRSTIKKIIAAGDAGKLDHMKSY